MTTDAHENGPHNQESPERQMLFEIQNAIKSLPPSDQHYIEMHAINIRRMMVEDSSGLFTMAFALVGAEQAAK
jgi:hypothetical protein